MENDHTSGYLFDLSVVRGRSDNTIQAYKRDLALYFEYLANNHLNYLDVSIRELNGFFDYINKGFSKASQARMVSGIKGFYAYLFQSDVISSSPFAELGSIGVPLRLPKAMTKEEIETLIAGISGSSLADLRDLAIIELLYGTGKQ